MSNFKKRNVSKAIYMLSTALGALLVYGFASNTLQANGVLPGSPQQANGVSVESRVGHPLTKDERDRVVAKTLKHPRVAGKIQGHRVRAVRVVHERNRDIRGGSQEQVDTASVTVFDYHTSKTTRYVMNLADGEVLSEQPLSGHPQSSAEERDEAAAIIQADVELASLLQSGHKMIGGFIVEAPPGSAASHRYLHMRVVTEDMTRTARLVIVDLTDRVIASKQLSDN